jgi:hypothetical protein
MKIENTWTFNIDNAIRASGFPMKTKVEHNKIEQADIDRAVRLASVPSGTGHDTWLKGCLVSCDITAPQYWWMQWQRYHFHDIVSSQSKMHRILKMDIDTQCNKYVHPTVIKLMRGMIAQYNKQDITSDYRKTLFQQIISNCPMGLELTAGTVSNYLQLKSIYGQRRHHRLEEWQTYCDWIESLPKMRLILGGTNEN